MMSLCCTQKLLRRLGVSKPDAMHLMPTNALGNWYANLIYVGRAQFVMATNERSLLTVLLPATNLKKSLVPNLCEATFLLLQQIGVDPVRAAREVEAMQPTYIGRTENRSVLGSMNDFSRILDWEVRDGLAPMEIMLRFAETPMTGVVLKDGSHGFPAEAACRLLAG